MASAIVRRRRELQDFEAARYGTKTLGKSAAGAIAMRMRTGIVAQMQLRVES